MYEITDKIYEEIKNVIRGKDEIIRLIWIAILAQGHVLLEDVPGVGKTTMARSFAKALGLQEKRVQFTPDTMPSDIIGFSVYQEGKLVYQPGAVMTNLLLADEINRTSSKTQSALLEAMEEGHVTVDGNSHSLPEPFVVLATQNPVGSAGTQNLPNSQLDRFLMRLHMGYPDLQSQMDILKDRHTGDPLEQVRPVMDTAELMKVIETVRNIFMDDSIYDYIVRLSEATRNHPLVQLGVSPRASFALCRAVKAKAFVEKRDYVMPEDVQDVLLPVFAHRLILLPKARLNEQSAEDILSEILAGLAVPKGTGARS